MGYGDVSDGGGGLVEEDFIKMADITKMSLEDTKKEVLKELEKQLKKKSK